MQSTLADPYLAGRGKLSGIPCALHNISKYGESNELEGHQAHIISVNFQKGIMKVVVGMLAVLSTVVGQTCFEGPGGATVSDTKAGGHNIQVLG